MPSQPLIFGEEFHPLGTARCRLGRSRSGCRPEYPAENIRLETFGTAGTGSSGMEEDSAARRQRDRQGGGPCIARVGAIGTQVLGSHFIVAQSNGQPVGVQPLGLQISPW